LRKNRENGIEKFWEKSLENRIPLFNSLNTFIELSRKKVPFGSIYKYGK
jgi:hypothetical protein